MKRISRMLRDLPFGLTVWYGGDMDPALDAEIRALAEPGVWWAQGYNFEAKMRDLAFDYKSESERSEAIERISDAKNLSMSWF